MYMLNEDLWLKFDPQASSRYAIDKDCSDNPPDAILRIMLSGHPISVYWTILSNNCLSMVLADSQIYLNVAVYGLSRYDGKETRSRHAVYKQKK